jgi:predicted oxidoreductase
MKNIQIGASNLKTSAIIVGCMRISHMSTQEVSNFVNTAIENGITLFDHAVTYGGGKSEKVFGKALEMSKIDRASIYIQSKCGTREGFYDCSKSHILEAVDTSLVRLKTEYLDMLLLHRPDTLMEPEEIASSL